MRHSPERRAAQAKGMHGVRPHPFVREALRMYGTMTAWASIHCNECCLRRPWCRRDGHAFTPVSVKTVSSWTAKRSKKSIPRRWADLIASEFVDEASGKSLVPATGRTWPNGIL